MDPEVAAAVPELVGQNVLAPEQAAPFLRVARGELLSVRNELRVLLYGGVSLVMAGVGLLVKENIDRLGPVTIAVALGLAAAACLGWVARVAPRFSWREQPSPNLAFDYLLLLGTLLAAADLAYIEVKFTPLGANWPWHLLLVALLCGLLAFRYDSRVLFSLSLTTLAAWRGVSLGTIGSATWRLGQVAVLRWNAVACGVVFVVAGWALQRFGRKPHFEPTAVHLGWLLLLGGLASGALEGSHLGDSWPGFALLLLAVAGALAVGALRARRFSLFAIGVLAGYIAVSRFAVAGLHGDTSIAAWFCVSAIACVVGLVAAQHRMRQRP
ncbi:MAG: DUF2157 domain-containing protein [Thermoanaerobaculales bacterium]